MTPAAPAGGEGAGTAVTPDEGNGLLDVAGAATYLGVTQAFVRRLVLERRVRYYKLGKFVRFRPPDLDAFVEAGRREPVAPWARTRSTAQRSVARTTAQNVNRRKGVAATPAQHKTVAGR